MNPFSHGQIGRNWEDHDPYAQYRVLVIDGLHLPWGGGAHAVMRDRLKRHTLTVNALSTQPIAGFHGSPMWSLVTGITCEVPDSADWSPGTGDFAWEWGGVPTASGRTVFFAHTNAAGNDAHSSVILEKEATTNKARVLVFHGPSGGSFTEIKSTNAMSLNSHNDIMVRRSGTTLSLGLNGATEDTATIGTNSVNDPAQTLKIGAAYGIGTQNYLAYLRATKGFCPPYARPAFVLPARRVGG